MCINICLCTKVRTIEHTRKLVKKRRYEKDDCDRDGDSGENEAEEIHGAVRLANSLSLTISLPLHLSLARCTSLMLLKCSISSICIYCLK